jgi:hypothetical protein
MEEKSEFSVAFEGFSLITIGIFVVWFHVLRLVPESDTILFSGITVFGLLQMGMKIALLILIRKYYKIIMKHVSIFYVARLEVYPKTKSDLNFIMSMLNFFSLLVVYALSVPGLKYILLKFNDNFIYIIWALDILFVIFGIIFLKKTWKTYQAFVSDLNIEKSLAKTEEQQNSDPGTN